MTLQWKELATSLLQIFEVYLLYKGFQVFSPHQFVLQTKLWPRGQLHTQRGHGGSPATSPNSSALLFFHLVPSQRARSARSSQRTSSARSLRWTTFFFLFLNDFPYLFFSRKKLYQVLMGYTARVWTGPGIIFVMKAYLKYCHSCLFGSQRTDSIYLYSKIYKQFFFVKGK